MYDAEAEAEPKACSTAVSPSRKKRIENLVSVLGWDSRTIVVELHAHDGFTRAHSVTRGYPKQPLSASGLQRVMRVGDHVDHHLAESGCVGADRINIRICLDLKRYPISFQLPAEQRD